MKLHAFRKKKSAVSEDVSLTEIYDIAKCTILGDDKSDFQILTQTLWDSYDISETKNDKYKYITFMDTLSLIFPSTIRLKHNAVSEVGLRSWKISLEQSNKIVKEISGESELIDYTDININELNIYGKGTELICKLFLKDYEGNEFTTANTRIKLSLGKREIRDSSHSIEIYFIDEKASKKKYKDILPEEIYNSLTRIDDIKTTQNITSETPIMRFRKLQWLNRFPFLRKYLFSLRALP